jgi:hypothetical protein
MLVYTLMPARSRIFERPVEQVGIGDSNCAGRLEHLGLASGVVTGGVDAGRQPPECIASV